MSHQRHSQCALCTGNLFGNALLVYKQTKFLEKSVSCLLYVYPYTHSQCPIIYSEKLIRRKVNARLNPSAERVFLYKVPGRNKQRSYSAQRRNCSSPGGGQPTRSGQVGHVGVPQGQLARPGCTARKVGKGTRHDLPPSLANGRQTTVSEI